MEAKNEKERSFSSKVKSFDFYRKLPQDLSENSSSGGLVSLICAIIIIALICSEFSRLLSTNLRSEMVIDIKEGNEDIQINMDIVFMRIPCPFLILEGRDSLFSQNKLNIYKQRLNKNSEALKDTPIEDASKHQHIDHEKLVEMIKNEEGCQLVGNILVKRVTGFIYINEKRIDMRDKFPNKLMNFSHKINHISFGDPTNLENIKKYFPKVLNPLDGIEKEIKKESPSTLFQYYLNVVPIKFKPEYGQPILGNQYTANSHKVDFFHKNTMVIKYDISPISVNYVVERESIFHFFVQISAIIGGIFTLAKVLDSMLYKVFKNKGKKADLE